MGEYDFMIKRIQKLIIDVPDFPKPGILFKDISPIFSDQSELRNLITAQARFIKNNGRDFDKIVAIESRGFLLGTLLAYETGLPLVLARKAGKLPRETVSASYGLEYGSDKIEIHTSDILEDEHVLIVDDVLATGGTASAVADIVDSLGGKVAGFWFLMEIKDLEGQDNLINNCPGIDASDIEIVL
jgi:adenine phosphoribosyltransferase